MNKKFKKLILPALAAAIFLPLVSMAASEEISLPERGKLFFQHNKEFAESFDRSLVNKEERLLLREETRLENRARHAEMMEILEAGDYNAWVEYAKDKDCPMVSKINEDNFSEFVEMHKLKMENRGSGAMEKGKSRQAHFNFRQ